MVESYELLKKYSLGGLKPYIYILKKSSTLIDYVVDTTIEDNVKLQRCEVRHISSDNILRLNGDIVKFNLTENTENRLSFNSKITISLHEDYRQSLVSILNELRAEECYIMVEDNNGVQYIQDPEFTSKFSYEYTFTSDTNSNTLELTYDSDSNNPMVILNEKITHTREFEYSCNYGYGNIIDFRMAEHKRSFINAVRGSSTFTDVTMTGGESMHKIEFIKQSFTFTHRFDGDVYYDTLKFKIPLSDYKFYFTYNLHAFMENRYSIIFKTSENNWFASGFEFGMKPNYTIETSDGAEELNYIEITLQTAGHDTLYHTDGRDININDSVTDKFVPVTRPILDPVTGLELSYYYCISKTESIYTLIQMVTESGYATDRYMCLEGYETLYHNLNIVGTYTEDEQFDFNLKFNNDSCAVKDNCEFIKMTKEIYTFSKRGDYYDVVIYNPCPWALSDIPNWIEASRTSGLGGVSYTVRFTCKQDATDIRKISYGYLQSFDNASIIQFILEKSVGWISPTEHFIDARKQVVTSYIGRNNFTICDDGNLHIEIEKNRGRIRITVPENLDEVNTTMYTVKVCDDDTGDYGFIYIYQERLYTRLEEEVGGYVCIYGTSYKKIRKYKGYSPDKIDILTDGYIVGEQIMESDPKCSENEEDTSLYRQQWRPSSGTICDGYNLYTKYRLWESFDGGRSYYPTEVYQVGDLIEEYSEECSDLPQKQYKMIVDKSQYECYRTNSYYIECQYWSYDEIEWYKVTPEVCNTSREIRKRNDPACGGGGDVPGYAEKWEMSNETYCKNGYSYFLQRKYVSSDGGLTYTATDEYRESTVSTGETCSDPFIDHIWRVDYGTYMCDGHDSYYIERYYYYYLSNPTVYILDTMELPRMSSVLRKQNDPACDYHSERIYRWNTEGGNTVCIDGDKYVREDYEYSDDNGSTWVKTGTSRLGALIEASSADCDGVEEYEDWRIDLNLWICYGHDSYYQERLYKSNDNINWVATSTLRSRQDASVKRLDNDPSCGQSETVYRFIQDGDNYICEDVPDYITRWVTAPREMWVCDGYLLRQMELEQISYDNGLHWDNTGNMRQGQYAERHTTICTDKDDCHFENDRVRIDYYCDGDVSTVMLNYLLDYSIDYKEYDTSYDPYIRLVTSSQDGDDSWYTSTRSSSGYRISFRTYNTRGYINCYWEIYDRLSGTVLHTSSTFTLKKEVPTRLFFANGNVVNLADVNFISKEVVDEQVEIQGSPLTEVVIGEKVNRLIGRTFYDCTELVNVTLYCEDVIPLDGGSEAFHSNLAIFVLPDLVDRFKVYPGWSTWASRIYPIED